MSSEPSSHTAATSPAVAAVPPGVTGRPHTPPLLIYSALTAMILLWTINYLVAKEGFKQIDSLTLSLYRITLATILMVPMYLVARRGSRRKRYGWRDYAQFARLGFLGIIVNQIFFTVGLDLTTVGHSSLIIAVGPVNILLLAVLLGLEHLTWRKVAGMSIAFAGVVVLAVEHGISLHASTLRGDLLTLAGSIGFSFFTVFGKKVAGRYDSLTINAYSYAIAMLLLLPLTLWRSAHLDWSRVGVEGWFAVVYMALGTSVVAYLIYFWALRHLAASRIGVFTYLQPLLGTLLGIFVLREPFTLQLVFAAMLVLAGVALTEWHPRKVVDIEDESLEETPEVLEVR